MQVKVRGGEPAVYLNKLDMSVLKKSHNLCSIIAKFDQHHVVAGELELLLKQVESDGRVRPSIEKGKGE